MLFHVSDEFLPIRKSLPADRTAEISGFAYGVCLSFSENTWRTYRREEIGIPGMLLRVWSPYQLPAEKE